jgi:hypothetical protein
MNPNMLMRKVIGDHGLRLITHLTMKRNKRNQSGKGPNIHPIEYPTIPHGYECYVCGSTFDTNQERLTHLEKFRHIDLYDSGSPQEKEEIRRISF